MLHGKTVDVHCSFCSIHNEVLQDLTLINLTVRLGVS